VTVALPQWRSELVEAYSEVSMFQFTDIAEQ
jgi:hypothetical protein